MYDMDNAATQKLNLNGYDFVQSFGDWEDDVFWMKEVLYWDTQTGVFEYYRWDDAIPMDYRPKPQREYDEDERREYLMEYYGYIIDNCLRLAFKAVS